MKVGDLVKNVMAIHTNPVIHDRPIEPGYTGIVIDIRPDEWNKPPMSDYVDVILSVNGQSISCGNYGAGFFEVVK